MQFQADILGVDVVRPEVAETTALGAAYAAGLAVGYWAEHRRDPGELARGPALGARDADEAERERLYRNWKKAVASAPSTGSTTTWSEATRRPRCSTAVLETATPGSAPAEWSRTAGSGRRRAGFGTKPRTPRPSRCRTPWRRGRAASSSASPAAGVARRSGRAPPAWQLAEQRAVLDEDLALVERLGGVQLELGARVGDVEVAHGELADPVGRAEGGVLGALHRQLVRVVGERRARRCAGSCSPRRGAAAAVTSPVTSEAIQRWIDSRSISACGSSQRPS